MKVVLFCGGLGTRLREHSDTIPKPLVNIGYRPILWHLMRYYAHFGHKEFILCLGYRGDLVREYFLNYNEAMTNDFVLPEEARRSSCCPATSTTGASPSSTPACIPTSASGCCACASIWKASRCSWRTTPTACSDLPLDELVADFRRRKVVASFAAVPTAQTFHAVHTDDAGTRHRHRRDRLGRALDQRRLLLLPARDLRLHRGGRGAGRAAVQAPDRAAQAAGTVRRVLEGDGHVQGQDHVRPHGVAWRCPWMVWKR